jgi:hypothetical protein
MTSFAGLLKGLCPSAPGGRSPAAWIRCVLGVLGVLAIVLVPSRAWADDDAGAGDSVSGCVESIPPGAQRPRLTETFPPRGLSGYAATLTVVVEHGKGESVLPRGLEIGSDAAKLLKKADFVLPDQDGGSAARLAAPAPDPNKPDRVTTTLELPVVPLPAEPGRHVLVLPPLPVAVARANGELATACTKRHTIVVEDPIAQTPEAKPKPNPPAVMQREEWTALKTGLLIASLGLLAGALLTLLARRWMARPKPVPPPPPPRPPWDIALELLDEVRHAGLLEQGRFGEYFDRVSDAVRGYLGGRYGFDGLESTTDEILAALAKPGVLGGIALPEIAAFLQECDLVKFANMHPTQTECTSVLTAGEAIVRMTMPRQRAFDATPRSERGPRQDERDGGAP